MSRAAPIEFSVVPDETERLDKFLADQLGLSRTQAARLVADKAVTVGGKAARASRVLSRGERVTVRFPEDQPPRTLRPAAIPLAVVYEDEHLAIIDKPAGLVVHPAPGHWDDTLVNALVARGTTLAGGAEGRPGVVHRLDRDTSGLMVVAKTDLAHRRLGAAIAARRVRRTYAALAWGHLDASPTVIEAPLARHPTDRKRMAVTARGRPARTDAWASWAASAWRISCVWSAPHGKDPPDPGTPRAHRASGGGRSTYAGGGSRRVSGAGRREAEAWSGPRRGRRFMRPVWHSAIP